MTNTTIRNRLAAAFASMACSLALVAFAAYPAQMAAQGGLVI